MLFAFKLLSKFTTADTLFESGDYTFKIDCLHSIPYNTNLFFPRRQK